MKSKLYFSDIIKIEKELQIFISGRIQNIYDVNNQHCYLMKIKLANRETKFLIFKPGSYLYQIKNPPIWRRKIPSSFCQKMRFHFKNKRITEISHFLNDRIIRLYAGGGETEFCLVIELFGEGNISITNHLGILLSFIYPHRYNGFRLKVSQSHPIWNIDKRGEYKKSVLFS